jgi:hypothetical protein
MNDPAFLAQDKSATWNKKSHFWRRGLVVQKQSSSARFSPAGIGTAA